MPTAASARPISLPAATNADLAATILRVSLGVLLLAHAGLKVFVFTPAGKAGYCAGLGLPAALAYLVIAAELFRGIALILGVWTRWVSLAPTPGRSSTRGRGSRNRPSEAAA